MKKIFFTFIACFALLSMGAVASAANATSVFLDGNKIAFDVEAIIENGRTLVQMRKICECLNIQVNWDSTSRKIIMKDTNEHVINMTIDNQTATIDNKKITLEAAPIICDNYTFVPLRVISEVFGIDVEWHGDYNTVSLLTSSAKIIKGTIDLPDPETIYTNATLMGNEDGNILYLIQDVGPNIDCLDLYVNMCMTVGYEILYEKTNTEIDDETITGIYLYNPCIPNRLVLITSKYEEANNACVLVVTTKKSCWMYYKDVMQLIPEEKIGDLDFSEWNTENPYIGKQFWIHKKRASNFLPSSVISSSPYVNVKVTGFSKVSNASYKANGIKKIEKIYVEVNGTSYECDIQLVTPPSSFTDSTEALKQSLQNTKDTLYGVATILATEPQQFYALNDEEWKVIQGGHIYIGMPERLFLIIEGAPDDVNRTTTEYSSIEQFIYNVSKYSRHYYYFENGILTTYQY